MLYLLRDTERRLSTACKDIRTMRELNSNTARLLVATSTLLTGARHARPKVDLLPANADITMRGMALLPASFQTMARNASR